mgnify:CR=1 FL=1
MIYDQARRHAKYGAICLGGGLLGVIVARSTWIGIPIAIVFFLLAAYLLRKALLSLPPSPTPRAEDTDEPADPDGRVRSPHVRGSDPNVSDR